MPSDKMLDLFMGILKENIQHEVCLFQPTALEKELMVESKVESKNMATIQTTMNTYK